MDNNHSNARVNSVKRSPHQIPQAKLVELIKTDLPKKEIAKILQVAPGSVSRAIKRYNLSQQTITDLDTSIRSVLRGLQDKYITALLGKDLKKEPTAVLHTGLAIIEDKLNATGSRNNGVAIQINIAKPDGEVTITNSQQPPEPVSEGT
jgi:predicted transcriptional regulator